MKVSDGTGIRDPITLDCKLKIPGHYGLLA